MSESEGMYENEVFTLFFAGKASATKWPNQALADPIFKSL